MPIRYHAQVPAKVHGDPVPNEIVVERSWSMDFRESTSVLLTATMYVVLKIVRRLQSECSKSK